MGEVPVIAYKIKEAKKEELLDNLIDLIKYMKEFNGKTNNK